MKKMLLAIALTLALSGPWARAAQVPQTVVVVFDDSGSMWETMNTGKSKIDNAKAALIQVGEQLPAGSQIGVYALNGGWAYNVGPMSPQDFHWAVDHISASGGTPLGAALKVGGDALLEHRKKHKYGVYRLLVITDGEASDPDVVERYLPDLMSRCFWVDVIGLAMKSDHSLATKVNTYRRADDEASLHKEITQSLAEVTVNSADTGDYDLLSAVSDDVVKAVTSALGEMPNQPPVGERQLTATAASGSDGTSYAFIFWCVVGGVFLFVVVVILVGAAIDAMS